MKICQTKDWYEAINAASLKMIQGNGLVHDIMKICQAKNKKKIKKQNNNTDIYIYTNTLQLETFVYIILSAGHK